jgi:predicted RNA-binding protein
MSSMRARRKVRLMGEAERLIDELLDWSDNTPEPNLAQIEQVVLELRRQLSEEMAREVIEAQATKQPAVAPACPRCGEGMTYKGQKRVQPQTWVGEVEIGRGYYHCAGCKEGLFPPG